MSKMNRLNQELKKATERLVRKYAVAVNDLTAAQVASALAQAIAAGDFRRLVYKHDSQQVVYIPFAETERLRAELAELREGFNQVVEQRALLADQLRECLCMS